MVKLIDALANLDNDTQDITIGNRTHTKDGGVAESYINRTGHASVKGEVVKLSTTAENEVVLVDADGPDHIGVIYENGIAEGEIVKVVVRGDAYALLQDSTAATQGNWVKVSDTVAGRIDASNSGPTGGTVAALEDHFTEIGHCKESVTAGTDKLCLIHLHFN